MNGALYFAMTIQVPFPIVISKENKWFVASCPLLDIATQGKTEKEVKENMADLINDYLSDPDTSKSSIETWSYRFCDTIQTEKPRSEFE